MPKPDPRSRRAKTADQAPQLSRADRLRRSKVTPQLPPNPAPALVERLLEVGLTEAAGMGAGPVSWATIVAFQTATGIRLEPWEARLLRRLSLAFVAESRRAEDEHCPAPWRGEVTAAEQAAELDELRSVLG